MSCGRLPGLNKSFVLEAFTSFWEFIWKFFFDLPADELFRSRANSLLLRSFSSYKNNWINNYEHWCTNWLFVGVAAENREFTFFSSTWFRGGEVFGGGGSLSVQFSGCESESALFELSSLTLSKVRSEITKNHRLVHATGHCINWHPSKTPKLIFKLQQ